MNGMQKLQRMLLPGLCALAMVIAATAYGGVPHPGFVLYGKVIDQNGVELHAGDLVWTFTPEGGGASATVTAELTTIEGLGGPYSYRVVVPFEIAVPGHPISPTALQLPEASATYVRDGSVTGTPVSMQHVVSLTGADVSSAKRVDVCVGCRIETLTQHSADTNNDFNFSLSELLRTFELHTATETHEYHVSQGTRDGYDVGPGDTNGAPHTGDYADGPDWKMAGREVVRMIDLFNGTPDHTYTADPTTPDGFKKVAGTENKSAIASFAAEEGGEIVAKRTIRGGAIGDEPAKVEVTVDVTGNAVGVSAAGLTDQLADGMVFDGAIANVPALAPAEGAAGDLDFAWFPVPALPTSFSYGLDISELVPENYLAASSEGYYRFASTEDEHAMLMTSNMSAGTPDLDSDGDGISDSQEGYGDSDRDGVPNLFDVDSDNDALSDEAEAGVDGDPVYNPYHPDTNPTGTDTSIDNPDTDGDGTPDSEEINNGSNPVPQPKAVPAIGGVGLAALCAAIAAAAVRRRK